MNTLWKLGRAARGGDSPSSAADRDASSALPPAPIAWAELRTLADFATEATFTAPHTDDELFARRLWRNVEYYQTNYLGLLAAGVLLNVIADAFAVVRLAGLAFAAAVLLHLANENGYLPSEAEARRSWLQLIDFVAAGIGTAQANGRPEPTAAVSAVVILGLLPVGLLLVLCKMRWAIWAWIGVVGHMLARKPNTLSKLFHAAGSAGLREVMNIP